MFLFSLPPKMAEIKQLRQITRREVNPHCVTKWLPVFAMKSTILSTGVRHLRGKSKKNIYLGK
jgi:hypothetical protein